jgi:transcription elongation GreA/GreB family factor
MLEVRAMKLRELIARAPFVSPPTPGEARLHSHVRVRPQDQRELWYRIVVSVEAVGPYSGVTDVFWGSPVAEALVGKHPGDQSMIDAPAGETAITILEVRHQELPSDLAAPHARPTALT